MVGISLVEVYEWVGKYVTAVGKEAQKGQQVHFKAVKKLRKSSGFVIYLYFKDNAFTVVERDAKFYTLYVKGVSFFNKRYTKGGTFLSR